MSETRPTPLDEISEADWAQTPESAKRLVQNLLGRVEQLEQELTDLKAASATWKEQTKRNSKNSSKPPSQDMSKGFVPKEKKKGGGKAHGAQFGHAGHSPELYPVEDCLSVQDYYPEGCIECGAALSGEDTALYRVQQIEMPPVVPVVHEHRFHSLRCECCGTETSAWDEEIVNRSRYGERVAAHVGILSGLYRLSHRQVQALLSDLFGVKISTGSIAQLRQENSVAVAAAVAEAQAYVQQQAQVNMDETSFPQGNRDGNNPARRKGWLWVMVTPFVSFFAVHLSRAGAVAQQLLGEPFSGIVGSDRFSAYNGVDLTQRQVCWAHLKRDLTQIAERTGVARQLGEDLLMQQRLLFEYWHRVRDGTLSRLQFVALVQPIRDKFHKLLTEGANYPIADNEKTPFAKTVRTCQQLLKVEPALWTFVTTVGVEPTNNAAERALRPAVLWRKNSFGSQSQAGSLFVSRMLTVVTSLRAQNRPVLEYFVQACRAARQGQVAPSLLPAQDCTP